MTEASNVRQNCDEPRVEPHELPHTTATLLGHRDPGGGAPTHDAARRQGQVLYRGSCRSRPSVFEVCFALAVLLLLGLGALALRSSALV